MSYYVRTSSQGYNQSQERQLSKCPFPSSFLVLITEQDVLVSLHDHASTISWLVQEPVRAEINVSSKLVEIETKYWRAGQYDLSGGTVLKNRKFLSVSTFRPYCS